MRRGLLQLSALLVFFALAVLPEAAIAQQLCTDTDHGASQFEIRGQTLTHRCGDETKYRKVTYRFVKEVKARELATMDSALQPGSMAAIRNLDNDRPFQVYKLDLRTRNNFFVIIDRGTIPTEIVWGLWTDKIFHRRYTESGGTYNYDKSVAKYFNLVNTVLGLVHAARQYIELETDTNLQGYLKHVGSNNRWTVEDRESGEQLGGSRGCVKSYDQYINQLKYFPSRSIFPEGYTTNKELTIKMQGSTATIDLPGSQETGDAFQRPPITFSYKYYMAWRGVTRGDADYFYFLPPPDSPHCNLVLRISNTTVGASIITWPFRVLGISRETAQGTILPIRLDKITERVPEAQQTDRRLFELDQLGAFVLDYDPNVEDNSVNLFIRKLYPGTNLHDPNTGTGKKNIKDGKDELNAVRIFSGDVPGASTTTDQPCPINIPLIGPAMCTVADLITAAAISFANFSFQLLLRATTLQ